MDPDEYGYVANDPGLATEDYSGLADHVACYPPPSGTPR